MLARQLEPQPALHRGQERRPWPARQNALDQPDFYCPVVRGEVQKLEIRMAAARELPKSESSCTTIVIARG